MWQSKKNQYLNFWCVLLAAGCQLIIAEHHHHHHIHPRGGSTLINKMWDKGNWRIRQIFDLHIIICWCINALHIPSTFQMLIDVGIWCLCLSISSLFACVRECVCANSRKTNDMTVCQNCLHYVSSVFLRNANNKHFWLFLSYLTLK